MSAHQVRLLITYLSGVFLGALDQGILGPVLTTIVREFNISPKWGVWMVTVYTLVYAVSMPITAKLADRYGRRKIFMAGIGFFALGSLLCGMSQNLYQLLLARALQALGAGGIFPVAVAEVGLAFSKEKRGKALGLFGATHGMGSIVAPILGGFVIEHFSWPWLFYINVPASLLIIVLALGLPEDVQPNVKAVDWRGAILVGAVIFCFMLGLTHIQGHLGWSGVLMPNVYLFLLGGLLLIPVLVKVESRAKDPVLNLDFFRNPRLVLVYLLAVLSGMVLMSILFLPAYVEFVLHYSPGRASYMVAPLALASVISAPLGGVIADKYGASRVLLIGFLNSTLGAVILSITAYLTVGKGEVIFSPIIWVITGLVFLGGGLGLVVGSPLNLLVMEEVKRHEISSGLAVVTVIRSFGNTMGPVLMGGLLATATAVGDPRNGFIDIFLLGTTLSVVGIFITLKLRKRIRAVAYPDTSSGR